MTVTGFKDPGCPPPTNGLLHAEAREASDRNLFGIITQSWGAIRALIAIMWTIIVIHIQLFKCPIYPLQALVTNQCWCVNIGAVNKMQKLLLFRYYHSIWKMCF